MSPEEAASFEDRVRKEERDHIGRSRAAAGIPDDAPLAGLALSGGGIRSATFNLGLLQALAQAGKLRRFDYLSTVSGGGYIGGWLTAWVHRQGLDEVERQLRNSVNGTGPEPHEVRWLRAHSNYLTPRKGLLSIDTLWGGSTYVRNMLINQFLLIALITTALLAGALCNAALLRFSAERSLVVWTMGAVLLLAAAPLVGFEFALLRGQLPRAGVRRFVCWLQENKSHQAVAALTVSGAALMAYALAQDEFILASSWGRLWPLLPLVVFPAFWILAALSAATAFRKAEDPQLRAVARPEYQWVLWLIMATLLFNLLQNALAAGVSDATSGYRWLIPLLGPVLYIAVFEIATLLLILLAGRSLRPFAHDWLSRMAAEIILFSVLPVAVFASWVLLAPTVDYLYSLAPVLLSTATLGWIANTVLGVLGGKSAATGGTRSRWFDKLLPIAPFIFVLGLFTLLVWGTRELLLWNAGFQPEPFEAKSVLSWIGAVRLNLERLQRIPFLEWAIAAATMGFLTAILAWRVDINLFSFHAYYRNRISHAYLGASARDRKANAFTGYAPADSPSLEDLKDMKGGASIRPYPLINTALNLSGRPRMEWQQRKAASFVFSPLYCGYELPAVLSPNRDATACPDQAIVPKAIYAHRATADFIKGKPGRSIGHSLAIAISGAAASPNMGYHTSPAVAALMTAFNVRLGWWMPNPHIASAWAEGGPQSSTRWILKELTANANEETRFVYLSDGGHFENLGVYELLRRRCRLIVASDASADALFHFEGFANLVHKARADLGVEIQADTAALRPVVDPGGVIGASQSSHLIAQITYPPDAGQATAQTGWLVYVKSSLPAKLPADIENYHWASPGFPHQSTGDQWFDETQFEAYRRLGLEIGRIVTADLRSPATQGIIGW